MDRERESAEAATHSSRFAALQRDPYGLGLLPEYGYGYLEGGSYAGMMSRPGLTSANSSCSLNTAGLGNTLSPFTSFDSSLEVDVASCSSSNSTELSSPQGLSSSAHHSTAPGMLSGTTMAHGNHSPFLQVQPPGAAMGTLPPAACLSHCSTVPARLGEDNSSMEGDTMGVEEIIQDRGQTRSPVNFREGRRASDGLVAQGIIAFRQKLRECMRARGMVELRQEHHQLQTLYASCENNNTAQSPDNNLPPSHAIENSAPPPTSTTTSQPPSHPHLPPHRKLSAPHHGTRQWSLDEPGVGPGAGSPSGGSSIPRRRPLMKRMSLPSESFDIQPHRLLAIKQSLHLEQQLDRAGAAPRSESQDEALPMAPPSQPLPPLAPPLPCPTSTTPSTPQPYDYTPCSKSSLQQQLLSHRLQQKRQVFQKHSVVPHQHAPHPHPHALHGPAPYNQLPLPQQLSSQLQQLQIDPNNLPRIDFGPHYSVQPQPPPQPQLVSAGLVTQTYPSSTPPVGTGYLLSSSSNPSYSQATFSTPPASTCQDDFSQLSPMYALSSPSSCSSGTTSVSSAVPADSFLEHIGADREDQGVKDSCDKGAGMRDGAEEDREERVPEPPSTPTHQWQRRAGVFMAVHPFQDSTAFGVPAAHAGFPSAESDTVINSVPSFSTQTDSSVAFAPQREDSCVDFPSPGQRDAGCSFYSPAGLQEDSGLMFSPPLQASASSPHDDHLNLYLHTLHSSPDSASTMQSLQGLKSGTGTVDLVGYACQHLDPSRHGNPSLVFPGGDAPPAFESCQLGLNARTAGSNEFTVCEQNDEHMDIS